MQKNCKNFAFLKRLGNKVSIITAIKMYNIRVKLRFELGSILFSCCTKPFQDKTSNNQCKATLPLLQEFRSAQYVAKLC